MPNHLKLRRKGKNREGERERKGYKGTSSPDCTSISSSSYFVLCCCIKAATSFSCTGRRVESHFEICSLRLSRSSGVGKYSFGGKPFFVGTIFLNSLLQSLLVSLLFLVCLPFFLSLFSFFSLPLLFYFRSIFSPFPLFRFPLFLLTFFPFSLHFFFFTSSFS